MAGLQLAALLGPSVLARARAIVAPKTKSKKHLITASLKTAPLNRLTTSGSIFQAWSVPSPRRTCPCLELAGRSTTHSQPKFFNVILNEAPIASGPV